MCHFDCLKEIADVELHFLYVRLPDDFDKPEFATVSIQRDLYYGYDTLMENVSDPSHIDFAHHKVYLDLGSLCLSMTLIYVSCS